MSDSGSSPYTVGNAQPDHTGCWGMEDNLWRGQKRGISYTGRAMPSHEQHYCLSSIIVVWTPFTHACIAYKFYAHFASGIHVRNCAKTFAKCSFSLKHFPKIRSRSLQSAILRCWHAFQLKVRPLCVHVTRMAATDTSVQSRCSCRLRPPAN